MIVIILVLLLLLIVLSAVFAMIASAKLPEVSVLGRAIIAGGAAGFLPAVLGIIRVVFSKAQGGEMIPLLIGCAVFSVVIGIPVAYVVANQKPPSGDTNAFK
jgi:hypothetical protein